MHPRNHGSRCPTSGVASARYTRGSIEEGPGVIIKRGGGFNSPIGLVIDIPLLETSNEPSYGALRKRPAYPASERAQEHHGNTSFLHGRPRRNGQIGWV